MCVLCRSPEARRVHSQLDAERDPIPARRRRVPRARRLRSEPSLLSDEQRADAVAHCAARHDKGETERQRQQRRSDGADHRRCAVDAPRPRNQGGRAIFEVSDPFRKHRPQQKAQRKQGQCPNDHAHLDRGEQNGGSQCAHQRRIQHDEDRQHDRATQPRHAPRSETPQSRGDQQREQHHRKRDRRAAHQQDEGLNQRNLYEQEADAQQAEVGEGP